MSSMSLFRSSLYELENRKCLSLLVYHFSVEPLKGHKIENTVCSNGKSLFYLGKSTHVFLFFFVVVDGWSQDCGG